MKRSLRWDTVEPKPGYVRVRSANPYHTARWTKLSRAFREEHPLCEMCKARGVVKPATCVDHIEPWPICGDRFFDRSNLQSLCDECNHLKGQYDKIKIQAWKKDHQK